MQKHTITLPTLTHSNAPLLRKIIINPAFDVFDPAEVDAFEIDEAPTIRGIGQLYHFFA